MLDTLKRIGDGCPDCQELHAQPFRFRVSISEDSLRFNAELALDLVWLNKRPVLHVVEVHILYQNAAFINGKSYRDLWKFFLTIWDTIYSGYPDVLRVDREPSFMGAPCRDAAEACSMVLQSFVVEQHNAIGAGERYHSLLRRVFNVIRLDEHLLSPTWPSSSP